MDPLTPKRLLDYLLEGNELTSDQLDEFIRRNPEEGQYFDYKPGIIATKQKSSEGSKIIRKWVSGFANSEGGVLFVGVDESKPNRQIVPCEQNIGRQPLAQWASSCLHDMIAYFSPQPRFQVIKHSLGPVLAIAVARAPSLVPCLTDGTLKYFLRLGDSTLEAREYLIADLVLGRRQHPLLDSTFGPIRVSNVSIKSRNRQDNIPSQDATFTFQVENLSLATAVDLGIGMVSWSLVEGAAETINKHLRFYIDIGDINKNSLPDVHPWGLVHRTSLSSGKNFNLAPFQVLPIGEIGPFYFPRNNSKVLAAMYIISKGAPPTWFQIEFDCSSFHGVQKESISISKKGSERCKVALWPLVKIERE